MLVVLRMIFWEQMQKATMFFIVAFEKNRTGLEGARQRGRRDKTGQDTTRHDGAIEENIAGQGRLHTQILHIIWAQIKLAHIGAARAGPMFAEQNIH